MSYVVLTSAVIAALNAYRRKQAEGAVTAFRDSIYSKFDDIREDIKKTQRMIAALELEIKRALLDANQANDESQVLSVLSVVKADLDSFALKPALAERAAYDLGVAATNAARWGGDVAPTMSAAFLGSLALLPLANTSQRERDAALQGVKNLYLDYFSKAEDISVPGSPAQIVNHLTNLKKRSERHLARAVPGLYRCYDTSENQTVFVRLRLSDTDYVTYRGSIATSAIGGLAPRELQTRIAWTSTNLSSLSTDYDDADFASFVKIPPDRNRNLVDPGAILGKMPGRIGELDDAHDQLDTAITRNIGVLRGINRRLPELQQTLDLVRQIHEFCSAPPVPFDATDVDPLDLPAIPPARRALT